MISTQKRISLFCGHYGSGKTNIAINYACMLRAAGLAVSVADMDIVNPYFRTSDSREMLQRAGIGLVCSPYAGSNVDLAALPKELYDLVRCRDVYAVMDVGGDERGALALGRYVPEILEEDNYAMYFVVNFARPLTRTVDQAFDILREIEQAAGMRCTAIVHNTNLATQTTPQTLLHYIDALQQLRQKSGLPVAFWSAEHTLIPALADALAAHTDKALYHELFPLHLQAKITD